MAPYFEAIEDAAAEDLTECIHNPMIPVLTPGSALNVFMLGFVMGAFCTAWVFKWMARKGAAHARPNKPDEPNAG